MVEFENGQLVKGAYVIIDGKEYQVHMPQYSGQTPLSSENMNKLQDDLLKAVFPIGSTYVTQDNTNPNTILKFGTWERLKGKVCLGIDEKDSDFNTIGKTGGEKKHALTIEEMPSHRHSMQIWNYYGGESTGAKIAKTMDEANGGSTNSNSINSTGGGQAHNNLQPYEVVGYMWIRRS